MLPSRPDWLRFWAFVALAMTVAANVEVPQMTRKSSSELKVKDQRRQKVAMIVREAAAELKTNLRSVQMDARIPLVAPEVRNDMAILLQSAANEISTEISGKALLPGKDDIIKMIINTFVEVFMDNVEKSAKNLFKYAINETEQALGRIIDHGGDNINDILNHFIDYGGKRIINV